MDVFTNMLIGITQLKTKELNFRSPFEIFLFAYIFNIEQNDQYGFNFDDDSIQPDLDNIDELLNGSLVGNNKRKSDCKISFIFYTLSFILNHLSNLANSMHKEFGLVEIPESARSKAKYQYEEYLIRKENRLNSARGGGDHGQLNEFLGIDSDKRKSPDPGYHTQLSREDRTDAYLNVMEHRVSARNSNR